MRQRSARDCGMLRPVVHPPVIFLPRHLAGIRDQILAADVVMLAEFRATQPREERLGPIRARAVQ